LFHLALSHKVTPSRTWDIQHL